VPSLRIMWTFLLDAVSVTGFPIDILEDIYNKYCGPATPIKTRKALAKTLVYLKTYPTTRAHAALNGWRSRRTMEWTIKQNINHLYLHVNELTSAWQNRWCQANTIPTTFHDRVTGSLDTFPIYINRPSVGQRLYYNGNYRSNL
jgi:hypothetical protein